MVCVKACLTLSRLPSRHGFIETIEAANNPLLAIFDLGNPLPAFAVVGYTNHAA